MDEGESKEDASLNMMIASLEAAVLTSVRKSNLLPSVWRSSSKQLIATPNKKKTIKSLHPTAEQGPS